MIKFKDMKHNYLKNLATVFILSLTMFSGNVQSQYSVVSIPHQVYVLPNQVTLTTDDDKYSNIINLGFDFKYFGNTYNQMVVSTNGYIDF